MSIVPFVLGAKMIPTEKLLCLAVMLLLGCFSTGGCGHQMPSLCKEFYDLTPQDQEVEFRVFSVEKQLEVYRCEMRRKPPNLGRAYDIASRGVEVIPILLERLKAEEDEHFDNDLIYIFRIMSRDGYLEGRKDVVDEIKNVVSRIRFYR